MREYLRPYYGQLALMISAAIAAVSAEIAIPLLTKSVIDSADRAGHPGLLLPLGLAAIALGAIQAGLNFYRRWPARRRGRHGEDDARRSLPSPAAAEPAFHDSWQSGQLLSRATNDLSTIRRFAGLRRGVLHHQHLDFLLDRGAADPAELVARAADRLLFLPVAVLCLRFEKRYRVLSRLSQDQQGDLATYVEEAATGIRVLKSLGRRDEAAARHLRRPGSSTGPRSTRPGCAARSGQAWIWCRTR